MRIYNLIIKVFEVRKLSKHKSINDVLVSMFNNILDIEEDCVCRGDFKDLSITEMHIIEHIGVDRERTMSDTAKDLRITSGTLTIAINNLIKKGYVERQRSEKDRRIVYIKLTQKGVEAYRFHENFHVDLVFSAIEGLDDNQQILLLDVLTNINKHFKSKMK